MNFKIASLAFVLSFLSLPSLFGQSLFEYATIYRNSYEMVLTKKTKEELKIDRTKDDEQCVLQKIEELNKEGWEVYSAAQTPYAGGFKDGDLHYTPIYNIYFLRRKK